MTNYTLTSFNNLKEVMIMLNTFTNGIFWTIILLIFNIAIIFSLINKGNEKGLVTGFFITLVLSILMFWAGLIESFIVGIFFLGTIIGVFLII